MSSNSHVHHQTNEHRDIRARKPLVPYGIPGVRESSGLQFLTSDYLYIDSSISLARTKECKKEWCAEGGSCQWRSRGWINQWVARTSREGSLWIIWDAFTVKGRATVVQMGCGAKRGIAFRRVWVLWGAYGVASPFLRDIDIPFSPDIPSERCCLISRSRPRSVYCDVKLLTVLWSEQVFYLKNEKLPYTLVPARSDKSVWLARRRVAITHARNSN